MKRRVQPPQVKVLNLELQTHGFEGRGRAAVQAAGRVHGDVDLLEAHALEIGLEDSVRARKGQALAVHRPGVRIRDREIAGEVGGRALTFQAYVERGLRCRGIEHRDVQFLHLGFDGESFVDAQFEPRPRSRGGKRSVGFVDGSASRIRAAQAVKLVPLVDHGLHFDVAKADAKRDGSAAPRRGLLQAQALDAQKLDRQCVGEKREQIEFERDIARFAAFERHAIERHRPDERAARAFQLHRGGRESERPAQAALGANKPQQRARGCEPGRDAQAREPLEDRDQNTNPTEKCRRQVSDWSP